MKKKLLIALLAITTAFSCVIGFTACDGEKGFEKVSGSEGLEYTLSDDGTFYYLSGLGTCTDTEVTVANYYNDLPVKQIGKYVFTTEEEAQEIASEIASEDIFSLSILRDSDVTSVIIPEGITAIGMYAFGSFGSGSKLEQISIPDSVTAIVSGAFDYCDSLKSIKFGKSLTTIGDEAFRDCKNLTSITIPDGVTYIGVGAFRGCESLEKVTIGNGVNKINKSVFSGCNKLTSITITDSVTSIDYLACELKDINFEGTKEQWNDIEKVKGWNHYRSITIHCIDGDISESDN